MSYSVFKYYLDPHIYLDTSEAGSTINFKVVIQVFNQSGQTLYFRISQPHEDITPNSINLGSLGSGANAVFYPTFSVPKPSQDVVYSGNWKIEAFTDSNYSNKVTEATKYTEVHLYDLSQFSQIDFSTFDDGTTNDWSVSNFNISSDWSVLPGYSLSKSVIAGGVTSTATKTVSIPYCNIALMSYYIRHRYSGNQANSYGSFTHSVTVNDQTVYSRPVPHFYKEQTGTYIYGPVKLCINLTPFQGQNATIRLTLSSSIYNGTATHWLDHIRIAYKTY